MPFSYTAHSNKMNSNARRDNPPTDESANVNVTQ